MVNYFFILRCGLFALILLSSNFFSQTQSFQWVKQIGGNGMDFGRSITTDAAGNVYVTGNFQDTCDFDPGPATATLSGGSSITMFVAKYDASGALLWAKQFAPVGGGYCIGNGINVSQGNSICLTGNFSGTVDFDPGTASYTLASYGGSGSTIDAFNLKLDMNGNFVSAANLGVPVNADRGRSVVTNSAGVGYISVVSATGPQDDLITIFNFSNTPLYNISVVSSTDAVIYGGLAADNFGNSIVSGSFRGQLSFGSNTLTSQSQTYDVFIAMYNTSGSLVWVKRIGGSYDDIAGSAASDGTAVYVTGYYGGTVDFDPGAATYTMVTASNDAFILKLNGSGNLAFARSLVSYSSSVSYGIDVKIDFAGNVYSCGYFAGKVDFDPGAAADTYSLNSNYQGAYLLKLSASGNFSWKQILTSTDGVTPYALCTDGFNNVYTIGTFLGTTDFNASGSSSILVTSTTDEDIFIQKTGSPVGLEEFKKDRPGISIYPNPCYDHLAIRTSATGEISIATITGNKMITRTIAPGQLLDVDLRNLSPGIYIVSLLDSETGCLTARKFIRAE